MCEVIENSSMKNERFYINFNQDFTSLSVVGKTGYRIFTLSSVDRVDEIFCSNNENTRIAERLFSSSLVAVVTVGEPKKLKVCHFKKGTEICNYGYPSTILTVKLNRSRLIVCLNDSIYIHNIRDMKLLHSIRHIPPNEVGLCTLSLNSQLAYPVSSTTGELEVFDAVKLTSRLNIKAHDSILSALNFSPNGQLIATASERGTVIRVFCTKNAQKVHEFRRGVKRNAKIASLTFSLRADYICVSSNTETVHIFKIDQKAVQDLEQQHENTNVSNENNSSSEDLEKKNASSESRWSGLGFLTKAVTSYFPSQVSDVLNQDRAFATVQLAQPGIKCVCVLGMLQKEMHLLIASEDGFLYIYEIDVTKGGECKFIQAHDLRTPLHDVTELDMNEGSPRKTQTGTPRSKSTSTYAGVLKGPRKDLMSDSDKCRDLSEAVDCPPKSIFDDIQFPPVTSVRE